MRDMDLQKFIQVNNNGQQVGFMKCGNLIIEIYDKEGVIWKLVLLIILLLMFMILMIYIKLLKLKIILLFKIKLLSLNLEKWY